MSAAGIGQPVIFNTVAGAAVDIPDPYLRAVIETALSKAEGKPIAPSEMATLTRLEASEADIRDLTGLEHATNLTVLKFDNNSISDHLGTSELNQSHSPTSLEKLGIRSLISGGFN